jgi:hypothetical protein
MITIIALELLMIHTGRKLNRKVQIKDPKLYPEYYVEVMDSMYLPEASYNGLELLMLIN